MASLLALLSAASWGSGDFLGGYASRRGAKPGVVIVWGLPLSLAVLALAVAIDRNASPHPSDIAWGLAAGLVGSIALSAFYKALAIGPMSIAAPVSSVTNALVPFSFGVATGDALGAVALIGVVCALVSVVAVSLDPDPAAGDVGDARRCIPWALAAGVGFGAFFVLIDHTSSDAGLWPLLGVKASSGAVQIAWAYRSRTSLRLPRDQRQLSIASGLFDAGANGLFLFASRRGQLSQVAVLASLYPVATVLWARVVLKERLGTSRMVGLAGALGAAILLGTA